MKKPLITLVLISGFLLSFGQIPVYRWKGRIAASANDYGEFIQTDAAGNVYLAGRFSNGADFDPGAGSFILNSAGSTDLFLAKYDSSGILLWAFGMGGTGTETPKGLEIDPSGDIYLIGDFSLSFDADPGSGTNTLTAVAGTDFFISKFTSSGQFLHAYSAGGANSDQCEALAFDTNGNAILVGEYASPSLTLDPPAGNLNLLNGNTTGYTNDPYIIKFDSICNPIWAISMTGTGNDFVKDIISDNQGGIWAGGYFTGSISMDTTGQNYLNSAGQSDCFVARFTQTGIYDTAWTFGGVLTDNLFSIAFNNNTLYTTGTFNGTADLAPGADTLNAISNGGTDVFINSFDLNANLNWALNIGGTGADNSSHIRINTLGEIYVSGSFLDSIDFNSNTPGSWLKAYSGRDGFVAKFSNSGNLIWGYKIGSFTTDYSRAIAFSPNGDFWSVGYYGNANCYFDPNDLGNSLASAGSNDAYFVRYDECNFPTFSSVPSNAGTCPGANVQFSIGSNTPNITYQWQEGTNGGLTWNNITNGGIYSGATTTSLILTGVNTGMNNRFYRCIATADCGLSSNSGVGILFVGIPDTTVNVSGITLTAAASNAVYRWLNCGSGYTPVSGATGQSFTPAINGNYALEITKNGCTDTSSCYNISSVGLVETFDGSRVFIYPIPATNEINIKIEKSGEYLIGIYDINGRKISPEQIFQHGISLSLEGMESGTYLAGIRNQQEKLKFFRFIKN